MVREYIFISIHASREGSDSSDSAASRRGRDFNPRFPRGKRHPARSVPGLRRPISIHASREGSDLSKHEILNVFLDFNPRFPRGKRLSTKGVHAKMSIFQSTLPAGDATPKATDSTFYVWISIHASRGGSDVSLSSTFFKFLCISIHASRGGSDPMLGLITERGEKFQSTLPAGEATTIKG